MSDSLLSLKTSNQSLDTITIALPQSLAANVRKSMVEQVFVWVLKDNTSASSLIAFLQDNGFKNIKVDSKGTTITASGGGGLALDATAAVCPLLLYTSDCSEVTDTGTCSFYANSKYNPNTCQSSCVNNGTTNLCQNP